MMFSKVNSPKMALFQVSELTLNYPDMCILIIDLFTDVINFPFSGNGSILNHMIVSIWLINDMIPRYKKETYFIGKHENGVFKNGSTISDNCIVWTK